MRAKFIKEELIFNFDKSPPSKRYQGRSGPSIPRRPSPKKDGYGGGLSNDEKEIVERYKQKLQIITNEINQLELELQEAENDLISLGQSRIGEGELEQFYADVQNDFGFEALDILNSGISDEEKVKRIDALNQEGDDGPRRLKDLIMAYNFYHSEEERDPKEKEKLEKRIKSISNIIEEKNKMVDKLEIKIYNIETY